MIHRKIWKGYKDCSSVLEIVFVIFLSVVRKCITEKELLNKDKKSQGASCVDIWRQALPTGLGTAFCGWARSAGDIFSKSCSKREASRIHDITELRLWGERADNIRPLTFVGTQKIWNISFSPKNVKIKRKYTNAQNGLSKGMLHKQPSFTY